MPQHRMVLKRKRGRPMQQGKFLRALLAISVGLGVMEGGIRAQDPRPVPLPAPSTGPIMEQPAPFGEPFVSGDVTGSGRSGAAEGGKRHKTFKECVRNYFQSNVPICCWAHHNSVGCGNIWSEFVFVFGSCRSFYGEPCLPRPPPPPAAQGYGPGYGYGQEGKGDCRCP
jgi:hypothetical protein